MINNNIQEAYCSDEVIRLLLKHGFNVDSKLPIPPTHALAIEWIRVNFGIWITVDFNEYHNLYQWSSTGNMKKTVNNGVQFKTPQEATEAAIEYTLKNLIP